MTKTEQTKFLDECAMRAMQGICASNYYIDYSSEELTSNAYELAEAMLKEKLKREQGDGGGDE